MYLFIAVNKKRKMVIGLLLPIQSLIGYLGTFTFQEYSLIFLKQTFDEKILKLTFFFNNISCAAVVFQNLINKLLKITIFISYLNCLSSEVKVFNLFFSESLFLNCPECSRFKMPYLGKRLSYQHGFFTTIMCNLYCSKLPTGFVQSWKTWKSH